jgi:hypothetical protein
LRWLTNSVSPEAKLYEYYLKPQDWINDVAHKQACWSACADKLLFPVLRDNSRRMTGMGQSNLLTSKLVFVKSLTSHLVFFALKTNLQLKLIQ